MSRKERVRVGIIGVGKLGSRHLHHLRQLPQARVVGIFDTDPEVQKRYASEKGLRVFSSAEKLIDEVEAVVIASPTSTHYMYAREALRRSRHVFVEKPMAETLDQARELTALADEAGVKTQVGYVERFNPAFVAAQPVITRPLYINAQRLAPFTHRGADVSVVLDLMTHDIDLLLSMTKGSLSGVHATGVAVVTDQPDMVSAYLEFDTGLVAHLTVSRIALRRKRRLHIYQPEGFLHIDLGQRRARFITPKVEEIAAPTLRREQLDLGEGHLAYNHVLAIPKHDAIREEHRAFLKAILEDEEPPIPFAQGYRVLQIAYQILDRVYRYIRRTGLSDIWMS